jgi:hypothetical protein
MKIIFSLLVIIFLSCNVQAQSKAEFLNKVGSNGATGALFIGVGGIGLMYASYIKIEKESDLKMQKDYQRISYGFLIIGGALEAIAFGKLIEWGDAKEVSMKLTGNGLTCAVRF